MPRGMTRCVRPGQAVDPSLFLPLSFPSLCYLLSRLDPPVPHVDRLYLLETASKGGIHELAGHMQALTRTLEALKSACCAP